jgi:hypothetical protein
MSNVGLNDEMAKLPPLSLSLSLSLSLISKSNLHGRIDNWKKDGLVGALHGFGLDGMSKMHAMEFLFESLFYMFGR